jgi:hypothetical protein
LAWVTEREGHLYASIRDFRGYEYWSDDNGQAASVAGRAVSIYSADDAGTGKPSQKPLRSDLIVRAVFGTCIGYKQEVDRDGAYISQCHRPAAPNSRLCESCKSLPQAELALLRQDLKRARKRLPELEGALREELEVLSQQ